MIVAVDVFSGAWADAWAAVSTGLGSFVTVLRIFGVLMVGVTLFMFFWKRRKQGGGGMGGGGGGGNAGLISAVIAGAILTTPEWTLGLLFELIDLLIGFAETLYRAVAGTG